MLKLDIDELRTVDLQIINTVYGLRQNLNAELGELQSQKARIKELQELVNDINKTSPELINSVTKIREHFTKVQKEITTLEGALPELRDSSNALLPTYNEMEKKNIKFVLDKRDFYRECLLDAFMYISAATKDHDNRLAEDIKVLSQITSYTTTPNEEVNKFAKHLEIIRVRIKQVDNVILNLKDDSIQNEVKIIAKYYQDSIQEQNKQSENLLTFMVVAVGIYLVFMIFFLRKS